MPLLLLAAGCGGPSNTLREAVVLPDGRIEWQADGAGLIMVPRGLTVTRTVRLSNRTGRTLRNVRARTSCPSCSSARIDGEVLADGESSPLHVAVSMPGPSYEGDRRIHLFVEADRADGRGTEQRTLDVATRDVVNRVLDMVDRPPFFEASWHEARELRLRPQVWYGPDVALESLRIESQAAGLSIAMATDGRSERVIDIVAALDGLRAGDVNTGILITAPGAVDGDDATLTVPVRGWIRPRFSASPSFIHLGTMSLEAAGRETRTVTIASAAGSDDGAEPGVETVRGDWSVVSIESNGNDEWLVMVRPAPKRGGECIDTLRVGHDQRDWLDIRMEVDVEEDGRAGE